MAQWDLTKTLGQYLDRHLVLPLLVHLEAKALYPSEDIGKAKLALLTKTDIMQYAIMVFKELNAGQEAPKEMMDRAGSVKTRLNDLLTNAKKLVTLFDDSAEVQRLIDANSFTLAHLKTENITAEDAENTKVFAKALFQAGDYPRAFNYLHYLHMLLPDGEESVSVLWGKFASSILVLDREDVDTQKLAHATAAMEALRSVVDSMSFSSPVEQLHQRTWLIHWSLFVLVLTREGRTSMVEWLFADSRYLNTIQTACPHILRYLTAAVVTYKKRRNFLKNLVEVIKQEQRNYSDPLTEFVSALYVNFDFEEAQKKLKECEELLDTDYFLQTCKTDFIENARLLIFELYCKIHSCIDIGMLSEKLNMNKDEAERWIVNLIRNARLDAKIDSQENNVIMGNSQSSIYQQVIDKTKALSLKAMYIDRERTKQKAKVMS